MRVEKILKQKYNTLLDKYNLLKAEIEQQTLFKRHINTYELEQTQKQLQEIFTQIERKKRQQQYCINKYYEKKEAERNENAKK